MKIKKLIYENKTKPILKENDEDLNKFSELNKSLIGLYNSIRSLTIGEILESPSTIDEYRKKFDEIDSMMRETYKNYEEKVYGNPDMDFIPDENDEKIENYMFHIIYRNENKDILEKLLDDLENFKSDF